MHYQNPFEATARQSDAAVNDRPSRARCSTIGVLLGAAIPLVFGLAMLIRFRIDVANAPPGTGECSSPAMAGMSLILFGVPVCSLAGGIFGVIAQFIANRLSRSI